MKRLLLIILLGTLATGCGTANEGQDKEPARQVNGGGGSGIVANEVKASLTEISPLVFQYEINNQTEEAVNLAFTSSQRYDYAVQDKEGKELFLFSSTAMFLQALGEEELLQGDTLTYDIDLHELKLEKGEYVLTAWMTPKDGKKYKVSKNFTVD